MKSHSFYVCSFVAVVVLCSVTALYAKDINYDAIRLERRLHAVKITEKITIDGRLDEAAWDDAVRATAFTQREPEEGEPASERTEVAVLYDAENLYFGVVANDSEAGHAIISELKKDFSVDTGDSFQIVLDTFHDERNAYHFIINPAGAKWDAQIANEGREVNQSWDGVWYVKSRIGDNGWTAEIAIPFKTLKFPRACPDLGHQLSANDSAAQRRQFMGAGSANLYGPAGILGRDARRIRRHRARFEPQDQALPPRQLCPERSCAVA